MKGNPLSYTDSKGLHIDKIIGGGAAALLFCVKNPKHPACEKAIEQCQNLARKVDHWGKRNER